MADHVVRGDEDVERTLALLAQGQAGLHQEFQLRTRIDGQGGGATSRASV